SRRRHTRLQGDWSSDVCSSDLPPATNSMMGSLAPLKTDLGAAVDIQVFVQSSESKMRPGIRSRGIAEPVLPDCTTVPETVSSNEIGRASCRERVQISGGTAC